MDLDYHLWRFDWTDGPADISRGVADLAQRAEALGVRTLSVMDHFFQMEAAAPPTDPMLECYTALGYLAGVTTTLRLRALVTGVTYRHPGLLAKTMTTLDVLSRGRAELGIGAAWYEREHRGLGVPFPPVAQRFEMLEEALQICLQMWSDDDGPFEGRHYQLAETLCRPAPVSSPRPRIMIGGGGERKTLRLVAQYADACNLNVTEVDEVAHKLQVLREHCDAVGRDYTTIEKTMQGGAADPVADPDAFLRYAERLAGLGIEHIHLRTQTDDPAGYVGRFGETVAPRLAAL
jgi:F420-dependent oxidoreductase-like protein